MKRIISFFEIPAADFKRAVKFYEAVFNVQLSVMDCETEKMAFFPEEEGECPGSISYAENFRPTGGGVLISLNVEDMEKAIATAEANGGKVSIPKTKILAENRGFFCVIIDSEGNPLGLYSER